MAIAVAPTASSIVTEGMKKAGYGSSKVSSTLTRATDEWMQELIQLIWKKYKKINLLENVSTMSLIVNRFRYPKASNWGASNTMFLLDGSVTGTAQTGTASSITLASDFSGDILGREILITENTGAGSISQCTAFDTATKVATVSPNFNTAPDSTSKYRRIDNFYELKIVDMWKRAEIMTPYTLGRPTTAYVYYKASVPSIVFDKVPDDTYGIRSYFFTDLTQIDLASNMYTRILREWRGLFVQGIRWKALENIQDKAANKEQEKFFNMIRLVVSPDVDGYDQSDIQIALPQVY